MATTDPRIDAYIAAAAPFARPILKHIRKLVHTGAPKVVETLKWSMPHFEHKGVMCGMAAFKAHCSLGFWKSELIFGDNGPAEGAAGQFGRITQLSDLPPDDVLLGYVRKAVELNEAGVKSPDRAKPKPRAPLEMPGYFAAALRKNSAARKTFESLSASAQREYVEWLTEAKRETTRAERLATSVQWLADGKPRNWKYLAKSA